MNLLTRETVGEKVPRLGETSLLDRRLTANDASRNGLIVSPAISSIDCILFSLERSKEMPANYRVFTMKSIPGYHLAIWDGTLKKNITSQP